MIKRMATCIPRDGIDPDYFWNYHTSIHAPDILKVSEGLGFHRYTMSRVVKVLQGHPGFYDLTEIWYEDEASMEKCQHVWKNAVSASGRNIADDFDDRAKENCSSIMEQVIARDECQTHTRRLQTNELVKLAVSWRTREDVNQEEFWKYFTDVHTAHFLKGISTGLKKQVVSRVIRVAVGKENQRLDGLLEIWWDNDQSMHLGYKIWSESCLANGKNVLADLQERLVNLSIFTMQEFVAKEYGS